MDKKEILIIDDEVDFRLDVAEMLVEQGYKVTTASNGQEALRHLREATRKPDLITVDMKMPVKDGYEVQREIKELYPHIPLILISGFLPSALKLEGILAFFSKPLNKWQFLDAVEHYVNVV